MEQSPLASQGAHLGIAYREALCQANLEFFRTTLPHIYSRLIEHPSTLKLWVDDKGILCVSTDRLPATPAFTFRWWLKPIYDALAQPHTRQQFLAPLQVPRLNADNEYVDIQEIEAFHSPIDPTFRRRFAQLHQQHYPADYPTTPYPVVGQDTLPITVVVGVASGWHLNRLTEDFRIRHLVIIENDIDMLLFSLYMIDWREMFHSIRMNGRFFSISIETDIDVMGTVVAKELQHKWPMFFAHGMGLLSATHETVPAEKIRHALRDSMKMFLLGWGFFDDEILSLKHATLNLKHNWPVCQNTQVLEPDEPVVVVGSGPSLDALLPLLQRIADHVVILCCSTAITALEKAGIRPDFLVVMERTVFTPRLIKDSASSEFLRSIPAIFPSSMHPDLPTLTDTPLMVAKLADSGALMYRTPERFQIQFNTNPTVTNFGLEIAALMGSREIYLFGVDFGYVDHTRHHASQSSYHRPEMSSDIIDQVRSDTEKMAEESFPVPGNFRDTVLTHDFFDMARKEMEYFITHRYPGRAIYNCNDGALINGTIALKPEEVPLDALLSRPDKSRAVATIIDTFAPANLVDEIPKRVAELQQDLKNFSAQINTIIRREHMSREQLFDAFGDIYLVTKQQVEQKAAAQLLHGSLTHMLSQCYQVVVHDPDDAHALAFARDALANIEDFLVEAQRVVAVEIAGC